MTAFRTFTSEFQRLVAAAPDCVVFDGMAAACAVCPSLGGRIFVEVNGVFVHRIDLDCVTNPHRPFNNFGGSTLWPAPEGGKFAFNYRGEEWYVQPSIDSQPFGVTQTGRNSARLRKRAMLVNRPGAALDTVITREIEVAGDLPPLLAGCELAGWLCYRTIDTFEVLNEVRDSEALLACWSLEQLQATDTTLSFCRVIDPRSAINFDYYEHPGDRIQFHPSGFQYKTDGRAKGQIGVRRAAGPEMIGFKDLSRRLLGLRVNRSREGLYFNIADNQQPDGPWSAADSYSIFNSDPEMDAFELELIGPAFVRHGMVKGSELRAESTFAVFADPGQLQDFIASQIGE